MRRKGGGVGAIDRDRLARERYKTKGEELASEQIKILTESVSSFKSYLQEFASRYSKQIKDDPTFRRAFQEMCASLGVDPLASNKGFWSETLGLGNFYYELAVQVIEVCLATRACNGGLIGVLELTEKVRKSRGSHTSPIGTHDVIKAVEKIRCLGSGFRIIFFDQKNAPNRIKGSVNTSGKEDSLKDHKIFIQCVPGDLTLDHLAILEVVDEKSLQNGQGCITLDSAVQATGWSTERVQICIEYLIKDGMVWVDEQHFEQNQNDASKESILLYWFPSFFNARNKS